MPATSAGTTSSPPPADTAGGGGTLGRLRAIDILVLCTGNICRSPMAEAFLRHRLHALGVEARVSSAGLLFGDQPAPAEGVAVMAAAGFDTSAHRSRRLVAAMVLGADLVVCMAREHLRHAVVLVPAAWPRTFTLKELVRRAEEVGPRPPGQPFDEWLAKVHAGRSTDMLTGASPHDDVADPIGEGIDVYRRVADEIDALTARLVELGWGRATTGGATT